MAELKVRSTLMTKFLFSVFLILIILNSLETNNAQSSNCRPSGAIRGRKPPPGQCIENDVCCIPGKLYPTYTCSPPVSANTKATLTLNSFEKGGDHGGGPCKCDKQYHSDESLVVALSTGWYNNGERCHKSITINGNGRSVGAMVVDERESSMGCDEEHGYLPPYPNNIVDASKVVWEALGVPRNNWGEMQITWSI